ncbi:MAG: penicillin-insensitive murein endopeptidase [Nannocystaceae bacterium]|nr:penicillin-insensitive murein endopeptidase [Nannocystaceae bacterium]
MLALIASEGSLATASESQPWPLNEGTPEITRLIHVNVSDDVVPRSDAAQSADEGSAQELDPDAALREVRWTVPEAMPIEQLAQQWGLRVPNLRALNPGLADVAMVPSGTALLVFRQDPATTTQSIGSPHRGRLSNGIPLPEGPHWRLRDRRNRAYGAEGTVRALLEAFEVYGLAHPEGPAVRIGELSYRRGGRAWPHVSHRTGRDVDIGYVMKPGVLRQRYWRRADETTLDVEKTWTLIKALGDTNRVQRIFISSRLQRVIKAHARTVDTEEEVAKYFRTAGAGPKQRYLITHENGHRDHLHVRFRCDAADRRCRGHGLFRIEPTLEVGPPVRAANANP